MDHGSIRLQVPNGIGVLSPYVEYDSYNDTVNLLIIGMSQLVLNNNGGYDEVYDDPAFAQAVKPLMLSEILKSYGQPEEILVSTYSLQPLGWTVLFDVQLFYPEHGFLIVFHSLMEFTEDGYIMGCPIKSNISMGIWEPKKYPALDSVPQNIRNNISAFSLSEYLRIDEATDMSIQDFYNLFKDNETLCLKTPPGVWHFPGY